MLAGSRGVIPLYQYPIINPLGMVYNGLPTRSIVRSPSLPDMPCQASFTARHYGISPDSTTIYKKIETETLAVQIKKLDFADLGVFQVIRLWYYYLSQCEVLRTENDTIDLCSR